MGFITLCWKNTQFDWAKHGISVLLTWALMYPCAWAQTSMVELTDLRVDRREGVLQLNVQLRLELGPAVEDALIKGLAVHFVAETDVMRDRWYWYDRKIAMTSRYYRLAYQPLTRRWRLNVSSEPVSGNTLAGSLSQTFETLTDALAVIRRMTNWKVAEMSDIDPEARQYVAYRFKLDVTQLPRPFQIAAGNQADWNLVASKQLRLTAEMVR